jgi:hypothetical protein
MIKIITDKEGEAMYGELLLGVSLMGLGFLLFGLCIGTMAERKAGAGRIKFYRSMLKHRAKTSCPVARTGF